MKILNNLLIDLFTDKNKIYTKYNSLNLLNKPELKLSYNYEYYQGAYGFYIYNDNKMNNKIIINMTYVKNYLEALITIAHELGHWEHSCKDAPDYKYLYEFAHLDVTDKYEAYKCSCLLENIADEYGEKYANMFGILEEYKKSIYNDKLIRENKRIA
ncbi:MAG: hypothetical protein K0R54_214 [Clostridiaceae bacterium]|jgi:hypothetical protein|nr:hypothetical protein [Clostridiaceae bacterium]